MSVLTRINERSHVQPGDTDATISQKQIGAKPGEWTESDRKAAAQVARAKNQSVIPHDVAIALARQGRAGIEGERPLSREEKKLIRKWNREH